MVRIPIFWSPARYAGLIVMPSAETGESSVTEVATATSIGSRIVAIRPAPPLTRVEDVVEVLHGVEVHDPYRWLEDESSPDVNAWVGEQQSYARGYLDALPERRALEARLRQVMDVGALGPSRPRGRYRFFLRREPGANQACLWVDDGARERVLVDPNPLSPDGTSTIDYWYASDDGELVAVGISEAGSEDSVLSLVETA